MNNLLWEAILFVSVFTVVLTCCEWGYRLGRRQKDHEGTGAVEAAVLGLLGLMLAFSFGAAQSRLELRRAQIIEEANAIGTAYLRLDLLPASEQGALRELFRRYLDVRVRLFQVVSDRDAMEALLEEGERLQHEIWVRAGTVSRKEQWTPLAMLLLPAINEMIDITAARRVMLHTHNPLIITVLLFLLAGISAIVAGFATSKGKSRNLLHMVIYALTISVTVGTVIDLDNPRAGLIRLESADQALIDLRAMMD
jgi:hypothetical protein